VGLVMAPFHNPRRRAAASIVDHLTCVDGVEIDGGFGDAELSRTEEEFRPGPLLSLYAAVAAY
jgi:hypothetical protein